MEQEKKDAIVDMAATLAARAEEFDMVLILAQKKAGGAYSLHNGLTVENCVFLVEAFKYWLLKWCHPEDG